MNNFNDKINEIIQFISKSDKKKIKNKLLDVIEYNKFCPTILGQGAFGIAYIPESKNIEVNIDNKKVYLPVVVKESHNNSNEYDIDMNIISDKLYITGNYNGITSEALILMYIQQLCKKTVNLPLILGYGTCLDDKKNNIKKINKIITTRHGLYNDIEVDLTGKVYGKNIKHKSYITTLSDLFNYIYFSKNKDGSVILPNGIKCDNISELYDYICISYLATYHLLTKNKIYPQDMHEGNIFIHWLNDKSYYNNENIKDCKNIIYRVKNKYYKIKTFGFVIILGDCGLFLVEAKKDVIIIGSGHVDKKMKDPLKMALLDAKRINMDIIIRCYDMLTMNEFKNSIAYNILNSYPNNLYPLSPLWKLWSTPITKDLSTPELLDFYYKKYGVDKYTKNKNTILIKI
jgi:hypothetical protein